MSLLHVRKLLLVVLSVGAFLHSTTDAYAQSTMSSTSSPRALQQAMAADDSVRIFNSNDSRGLSISGGFFSGHASGISEKSGVGSDTLRMSNTNYDRASELEHDQRVYALLIDGSYDFNYDFGSGLPLHPYVNGGMGMAMADRSTVSPTVMMQGGDVVPLFRIGGGVTYRLGEEWNLSLDYRTGFSGVTSDQLFTGRGQQPVDLQVLNMGMHFKF